MKRESFELLDNMLQGFVREKNHVREQIDDNLNKIEEAESFVKSLSASEDKDYKLFSPRSGDILYEEEVNRSNSEKNFCEDRNKEYYIRLGQLNTYIDTLQKMKELERKEDIGFQLDSEQRNKNLTVLNIQEEERQRIARDLHDTSLQNLSHLVHKLELCGLYLDQDPIRAKLELAVTSKSLKAVIEEIRNTIFDLRPMTFDDLGMKAAMERLLAKANENNRFELEQDIDDIPCENNLILVNIYRVVQECVSNSIKHSDGTRLILRCKCKENICDIWIEDNGKGFTLEELEKKERHFGLSVMRERVELLGGKLDIDSKLNRGTRTHLQIPLI